MEWKLLFSNKARKQIEKLPPHVVDALTILRANIEQHGPVQLSWPNYSKIKGQKGYYHCHLNKGKPRYVAVWAVENDKIKVVEVIYAGTHEKVDYRKVR
ncbi:type II toxin-antitoxin system RelE family toxin [Maridesulfovibrio bastinii]|uniref:type II toxin-antitoxin system RelE family toxin n=1 Tax=Maridesulfovibrio bastinii TaxID=47157 RepID=UPI0004172329|nr:hypothetical protein [Maridesulfovibrio bastinii]